MKKKKQKELQKKKEDGWYLDEVATAEGGEGRRKDKGEQEEDLKDKSNPSQL